MAGRRPAAAWAGASGGLACMPRCQLVSKARMASCCLRVSSLWYAVAGAVAFHWPMNGSTSCGGRLGVEGGLVEGCRVGCRVELVAPACLRPPPGQSEWRQPEWRRRGELGGPARRRPWPDQPRRAGRGRRLAAVVRVRGPDGGRSRKRWPVSVETRLPIRTSGTGPPDALKRPRGGAGRSGGAHCGRSNPAGVTARRSARSG